jgi:PII-like signaling protein
MLQDNQVWESEEYVLKIEQLGQSFHALIFKRDENLTFVEIIVDREVKIENMIKRLNLKLTNKFITLKDK